MQRPALTIGMAVYDDHPGVWFTLQSLRTHHPEAAEHVELLVVDNNPGSPQGQQTAGLVQRLSAEGRIARYVPAGEVQGTSAPRNRIFAEARGEAVLVLDAHVLMFPGNLERLLKYYADNPDCRDILSGPLVLDDGIDKITHFDQQWRGEMWGTWGKAWRCICKQATFTVQEGVMRAGAASVALYRPMGVDVPPTDFRPACPACGGRYPAVGYAGHEKQLEAFGYREAAAYADAPPFEIPGMGLGCFSCRRDAWLGFNEHARGFGGEELYIHEKFRRAGGKALCLPFLRWIHFFGRSGAPYNLDRYDKMRNYVLEFQELDMDLQPIHDHFITGKGRESEPKQDVHLMPQALWDWLLADPVAHEKPMQAEASKGKCTTCGVGAEDTIETLYDRACKTPADLHEHLPKLRELAAQSEVVVDLGERPQSSTVALLAGQPKRLVSYAPMDDKRVAALAARQEQTQFSAVKAKSLEADIPECDLLFLDTVHTAEHVYQELQRHGPKVRRWIVFHDTAIFGDAGSDGGPGILAALRRFMRETPEWSVVYHTQANYGLTVISRNPEDKPKLPSLPKMAWNYAKALARHVATGQQHADEATIEARLAACSLCDQRTDGERCSLCGCYLAEGPDGREGKALWAESECPLGKWTA